MTPEFMLAVQQMKDVAQLLGDDIEQARAYGQTSPTQFAVRTLIRTSVAYIEGLSFQFRQVALACANIDRDMLSGPEHGIIRDEKYRLDDNGKVKAETQFPTFLPALLFSLRCYARVWGATFEPNKGDNGWKCFQEFIDIRNCLEHPKSIATLNLTDTQIKTAENGMVWWKQTVGELLALCEETDKKYQRD